MHRRDPQSSGKFARRQFEPLTEKADLGPDERCRFADDDVGEEIVQFVDGWYLKFFVAIYAGPHRNVCQADVVEPGLRVRDRFVLGAKQLAALETTATMKVSGWSVSHGP